MPAAVFASVADAWARTWWQTSRSRKALVSLYGLGRVGRKETTLKAGPACRAGPGQRSFCTFTAVYFDRGDAAGMGGILIPGPIAVDRVVVESKQPSLLALGSLVKDVSNPSQPEA